MTYNYTKPRRPIATSFDGPGPCYTLPSLCGHFSHDPQSVHNRRPAYSFGQRDHVQLDCRKSGPGPGKYSGDSKFIVPAAPRYTLCGRPKDMANKGSPDPAAYGDISKNMTQDRAPAFSFGLRQRPHTVDHLPGPNAYNLPPSTIESRRQRAPSHIIASRSKNGGFHDDLQKTPGPAAYNVNNQNKPKPPQYSIAARCNRPGDGTKKPGPGAHHPESVQVNKRSAPRFSFGSRHSQYAVSLIIPVTS